MPAKSRAQSYTDYYKNNTNTPTEEEDPRQKFNPAKAGVKRFESADDKRKAAIRRRLMKKSGA